MINLLVRLFVKESDQLQNPIVRTRYGIFSGAVGIFLNLCLFVAKFIAGLMTSSIAITADALNNLSDAGSSVVTLVGFKMASAPADREHPFGHGRIEYLSGLLVSLAILLVGVELVKSSFEKILHPPTIMFSAVSFGILLVSVAVKLWMCYFNRTLGKRIDSTAMKATAMDSLTDAAATSAVAVATLCGHLLGWKIDGWIGMLVAIFILYTGFNTAKDSFSPLLGKAPEPSFVEEIQQLVLSHQQVIGLHDLIVHDYGPGRCMISLHAEIPSNADLLEMHDVIDHIELELRKKFHCEATIHMDPVEVDNARVMQVRGMVNDLVQKIDAQISIHDFRMVSGRSHTNLIFDVQVPYQFHLNDVQVSQMIHEGIEALPGDYFAVIRIERGFV